MGGMKERRKMMREIGRPEYGVTPCEFTYQRVKITATYEKVIDVDVDYDFYDAINNVIDNITPDELDYDYEIIGEETESVYVR